MIKEMIPTSIGKIRTLVPLECGRVFQGDFKLFNKKVDYETTEITNFTTRHYPKDMIFNFYMVRVLFEVGTEKQWVKMMAFETQFDKEFFLAQIADAEFDFFVMSTPESRDQLSGEVISFTEGLKFCLV